MDHAIKFGREMSSICVFLTCNATTKLVSKISLRMRLRLAEKNREKILQWQKHARTTGLRPSLGREISHNHEGPAVTSRVDVVEVEDAAQKIYPQ